MAVSPSATPNLSCSLCWPTSSGKLYLSREHGDSVVFGASSQEQIEQTLSSIAKGGPSTKAKAVIKAFWTTIKSGARWNNTDELWEFDA
ncbi:hypothetical protein CMQ_7220 [Grosmannia clavigera kw1407]|uniref:Uncharacterized protein n=1 Tax=Grosmannia clavigera (strain kw1407 / UAMH 11150) TaxID=655863 RepID=F0XPC5_GROCL|nr:uncharacterized protein CMQ_7220 [Grosmannia clavigera kw1407]EFX00218.1 hypothetical protein CMQ_7220 [Grosmannia clavigera kw1407]